MQNNRRKIGPKPSSPEDPSKCIKFSLFFLNVLFWLVAILILGVGVYMMVEKRDAYGNYLSHLELDPALLLVFRGAALFLITFLGCLGALRENQSINQSINKLYLNVERPPSQGEISLTNMGTF